MKTNHAYTARVEETEEGFYRASFPDFPDLLPIEGNTLNEVLDTAQDDLNATLADLHAKGGKPPVSSTFHHVIGVFGADDPEPDLVDIDAELGATAAAEQAEDQ